MDDDQAKLRRHYQALRGLMRTVDDNQNKSNLLPPTVNLIAQAIANLSADFPQLVPSFDYRQAYTNLSRTYFLEPIRAYLATIVGTLEAEMAASAEPVVERHDFPFIREQKLRDIVERDYLEIQRAFVAQCWKSTIVLAGGTIEAILLDLLLSHEAGAKAANSAPGQPDISKWTFADLIEVAVELKLVSGAVAKLSHPVREYRNLIHPGNEMRTDLAFDQAEARIALEVLNILHRDLTKP